MLTDSIIGALIGLVGACANNRKTLSTDGVIISSLAFIAEHPDCTDVETERIVADVRAEKFAVSPNCATCTSPCGNTSDYDMSRVYSAPDDVREAKCGLISELSCLAEKTVKSGKMLPPDAMDTVMRALSYISYDIAKEYIHELSVEVREITDSIGVNEND